MTENSKTNTPSKREQLMVRQEAERIHQKRVKVVGIVTSLLVVVLMIGAVGYAFMTRDKGGETDKQIVPPNASTEGITVNKAAGKPVLTVYQDYQCSACKSVHDALSPAMDALVEKGQIQLEYRTMTFIETMVRNDSSTKAAEAAACADTVGSFLKFNDTIFDNAPQEGVGYTSRQLQEDFPKIAGITGDNLTKFQQCVKDRSTSDIVKAINESANKAGITGTPTFMVNGKKMDLQGQTGDEKVLLDAIQKLANEK